MQTSAARRAAPDQPVRGQRRRQLVSTALSAGFVGLWTALMIKRLDPAVDVCVIEADVCGGGASGRCGGLVMTGGPKISRLARLCGLNEALRLVGAAEAGIDEIENFCSEHAPEAEFRRGGWLWTAPTGAQLGAWDKVVTRGEHRAP